jgi:hypothetical protein
MPFRFLARALALVLIVVSLDARDARADDFSKPSLANLTRTLVRFNALNLSDPHILNDFSILTECDLYQAFYGNDFKWRQVQQAVLESARAHIASFPTSYYYDAALQLDRYDFDTKIFRFAEKAGIHGVNVLELYRAQATECGADAAKSIPHSFRALLATPVSLDGVVLSEKDGQILLQHMIADGNNNRQIYARFNLRITNVAPLHPVAAALGSYEQEGKLSRDGVILDAWLDSIDFYRDQDRTSMVYHYQP